MTTRLTPQARFTSLGTGQGSDGQRRLPQLLAWDRYSSQHDHELEVDRLFRRGWNCIGLTDDVPKEGDYFTV